MRNILNHILRCVMGIAMVLFISTTANAQIQEDTTEHRPRFEPTTSFSNFDHMISRSVVGTAMYKNRLMWQADSAMVEALILQRKFERQLIFGSVVTAVGVAGIIYTLNMPTPVFFSQDGVPLNREEALEKRKNRRIAGAISGVVTLAGSILIVDSFKFNQRMEADLGLNQLKLRFFLTGKRDYFKGKKKFTGSEYFREYYR
ncbi:MAG: hypothetical protein ACOC33_00510 [bacterium]